MLDIRAFNPNSRRAYIAIESICAIELENLYGVKVVQIY